uniref:Uncharacterized protein n=1 Tax=Acrobeloides nanus TaxID=290746 RepID=A0A914CEJ0_9BILA
MRSLGNFLSGSRCFRAEVLIGLPDPIFANWTPCATMGTAQELPNITTITIHGNLCTVPIQAFRGCNGG